MNIFKEYDDIYGKIDITDIKNNFKELFEHVKVMRERLGRHKYVLDTYLHYFLEGVDANSIYSVGIDAYAGGCSRYLLRKVMRNNEEYINHPLYQKTKALIESKPLPFLEDVTKEYLYFTDLFFDYANYEIKEYAKFNFDAARREYDIVELNQLYDQVSILFGGAEQMEQLNELLNICFPFRFYIR